MAIGLNRPSRSDVVIQCMEGHSKVRVKQRQNHYDAWEQGREKEVEDIIDERVRFIRISW